MELVKETASAFFLIEAFGETIGLTIATCQSERPDN